MKTFEISILSRSDASASPVSARTMELEAETIEEAFSLASERVRPESITRIQELIPDLPPAGPAPGSPRIDLEKFIPELVGDVAWPAGGIPGFDVGLPGEDMPCMIPGATRFSLTLRAMGEPILELWFTVSTMYWAALSHDLRDSLVQGIHGYAVETFIDCETRVFEDVMLNEFSDVA